MIAVGLVIFIGAAASAIPKLNLDAFPEVSNIQVVVNTEAPGLAAEEVEQLISFPIESVMYALPDVAQVRSISKTGLSMVTVVFSEGSDIYFARQQVFERLQQARELIPAGVGVPEMGPNTSGLGQVLQYLLLTDDQSIDAMSLRSLNDWVVKLLLMPVEGVTDVLSFGGQVRQYQVNVDADKLLAYDLQLDDIIRAVEANNRNAGGWYMERGQEQLVIRGVGWIGSAKPTDTDDRTAAAQADIAQIPLRTTDGIAITLDQVAEVSLGGEIRQGAVTLSRRNSEGETEQLGEVVAGVVLKRMGANTKATIDGIRARQQLIQQALPEGVRFEVFYDQADLVSQAVNTVTQALLLAFALIVVILALFLMNLRATLLVLLSIPLSIGLALMVMAQWGLSANLMSLGGLAIAIGMLVDGSVVMVENLFKHLSTQASPQTDSKTRSGMPIQQLVRRAGAEVARPIFFAALIILLVFTPLFSFEGVEAKLFEPMAISIILALAASVVVALVVVPALACLLYDQQLIKRPLVLRENRLIHTLQQAYQKLLRLALQHPRNIIFASLLAFGAALSLLPQIGTEFVPELEEGTLNLRVTLAPSASLQTSLAVAPRLEAMLLEFPEVSYALSRIGRPEIGGDPEPVNNLEIYIGLKPVSEWTSASNRHQLQQLMETKLAQHPGLLFNFSQPIATRVDELLSGVKAQLAIKLFGPELSTLAEVGGEIEAAVKTVAGTRGVALEQISGEAQLVVRPDRQQLSRYGLSVGDVMELVAEGVGGTKAGQVIHGNERYNIYVRLAESYRNSAAAIGALRLVTDDGAQVPLSDLASIGIESGPPQVRRDQVQRRVVIEANVEGRDMGSVVADIRTAIAARVEMPAGYAVTIGGQFENQQRANQRLLVVVPLSLLMIALLLYFAFGSLAQALLILANIPLALIGGIVALYASGQYLSVPGAIGFITLFGVAVLNGVVLVESINQRLATGDSIDVAVFDGASSRLRPVLMTASTSALGLIPMLLATGSGAEIQKPLATVVVGGLFSATLLTLLVLPVLYRHFIKMGSGYS